MSKDRESKELIRKYRETGREEVREEFFRKNGGLSFHIAKQYQNTGIPLDERIACANLGLLKAFNSFDLERNVQFTTFATRCMHNEIRLFIKKNKMHGHCANLEYIVFQDANGSNLTLMDIIKDEGSSGVIDKRIHYEAIQDLIKVVKESLNEKEQVIFENMLNEDRITQKELSERLGVTQSYVNKLSKRIAKRARKAADSVGI